MLYGKERRRRRRTKREEKEKEEEEVGQTNTRTDSIKRLSKLTYKRDSTSDLEFPIDVIAESGHLPVTARRLGFVRNPLVGGRPVKLVSVLISGSLDNNPDHASLLTRLIQPSPSLPRLYPLLRSSPLKVLRRSSLPTLETNVGPRSLSILGLGTEVPKRGSSKNFVSVLSEVNFLIESYIGD